MILLLPMALYAATAERNAPGFPSIDIRPTLRASALTDISRGSVILFGTAQAEVSAVRIRVTTGRGSTASAQVKLVAGRFEARFPIDFRPSIRLDPGPLFVDAFDAADAESANGAEATLLLYDRRKKPPDYPSAFTTNLLDCRGRKDSASAEWPAMRALVNLYMRSRGARLAGVGRADFDLAQSADLTWFKKNLALYDFDGRDVKILRAKTFWQSVWDTWFNPSNNHPLDGNPANRSPSNYLPYAFTNDFADILIQHWMRLRKGGSVEDDLRTQCREATENLLSWQHRGPENFALPDSSGRREHYTAGAFRYGAFVDGSYLTEGRGWFYNPDHRDYAAGGVLNGRAVWALGEALKAEPKGPLAERLKDAIRLALQFCLRDGLRHGYTKRTDAGRVYWRDAGEHAYLTLGMIAACNAAPDLKVPLGDRTMSLREACVSALDALMDLQNADCGWAVYPNVDSMAIAALADGAMALRSHPRVAAWKSAARRAADAWLEAKVPASEFRGVPVHFGLRLKPGEMTYRWSRLAPGSWKDRNYLFFYQTGHWIHALARLFALTGEAPYRRRAEAMVSYLCGDNPWGVRLLNELGGVYNWVEDRDGDGIEEHLKQDMYPESTAFSMIGLFHLMDATSR